MKFLLDENMPPSLVGKLKSIGFECRHVADVIGKSEKDIHIFQFAEKSGEIIITHDLDFSTIHAFSGKNKPSIILFRIHHINTDVFFRLLSSNLSALKDDPEYGAFIVFEEVAIRIRKLPIRIK